MKKNKFFLSYEFIIISLLSISCILVSGCSDTLLISRSNNFLSTDNGTKYDPSKTFELKKFCNSMIQDNNSNPNLLNCSVGQITDVFFNRLDNQWYCSSCDWDFSKCSQSNISNILSYTGLNLSSSHVLSSDFTNGFFVSCCNKNGAVCYSQYISPAVYNGSVCDKGYDEFVGSITFNNVSNNWSVTSCLNGFK